MALNVPAKPARVPVDAGPTRGICYMCVDLGTSLSEFDGKMKRQVLLGFELPDFEESSKVDGRDVTYRRTINKFATLSMNEKATLRKMLEAWRGKVFTDEEIKSYDLFSVVGQTALINIVHKMSNGQPKADIGSITALPRGMSACKSDHPEIRFSMSDPVHNVLTGDIQPWVQNIVMKSNEWIAVHGDPAGAESPPDEQM